MGKGSKAGGSLLCHLSTECCFKILSLEEQPKAETHWGLDSKFELEIRSAAFGTTLPEQGASKAAASIRGVNQLREDSPTLSLSLSLSNSSFQIQ